MKSNRDDFTKTTKEILAKRVSYICSNPKCRKTTIGANSQPDKATSIGVAAHITAASSTGPRYDDTLTPEQRTHIDNGIWLCNSCSTLIDRDPEYFTVDLLRKWKTDCETESWKRLIGEIRVQQKGRPRLEVDLIFTTRGRSNRGYSDKNPIEQVDGHFIMNMPPNPIIFWGIFWSFNFVVYNNSSYPAFNVKIESIGTDDFSQLDSLPSINNLPPLKNIDLKAKVTDLVEGDYSVADSVMTAKLPDKFKKLKLKLSYSDEDKIIYTDSFEFTELGLKKV
ncbi:MAG: hypothetical protein ABL895_21045 [Cyclobacteriaceae bacterium]